MPSANELNLMAFEPNRNIEVEIHKLGMPAQLSKALFEIMPPRSESHCLYTSPLEDDARTWLDRAVKLKNVRRGDTPEDWLVSLRPVDLKLFCGLIGAWVAKCSKPEARETAAYHQFQKLLKPELFDGHVSSEKIRLINAEGAQSSDLVFRVLPMLAADALVGRDLPLGESDVIDLSIVSRGGDPCELLSDVRWYQGEHPYAFGLKFHTETIPASNKVFLLVDVVIHRYIQGPWGEKPYLKQNVNALVRTGECTYRIVPYGYRSEKRRIDWDEFARRNLEHISAVKLPEFGEYLANMAVHAHEGFGPQILSPLSLSASWAKKNYVETGVSMIDKRLFHQLIASELASLATPLKAQRVGRLASLPIEFKEPKPAKKGEGTAAVGDDGSSVEEGERAVAEKAMAGAEQESVTSHEHELWAMNNRVRLKECTGKDEISLQVIGTSSDTVLMKCAVQAIVDYLGPEGDCGGVKLSIKCAVKEKMLSPLKDDSDAAARLRWRTVADEIDPANTAAGCIVILSGADKYEELKHVVMRKARESGKANAKATDYGDPKTAIRMGLAQRGWLSQFLVAEANTIERRAHVAVRDLMRQMGFVQGLKDVSRKDIDFDLPVIGLKLYESPNGKASAVFPLAVKVEPMSGLVTAASPLLARGFMPYWEFQLELAKASTRVGFAEKTRKSVTGFSLKHMIDVIARDASDRETLLLVQAYGKIRTKHWWPGINNAGLSCGTLVYGPGSGESKLDLAQSKLAILRVRSGADGEVSDYFTDTSDAEAHPMGGGNAPHKTRQGLYRFENCVLGLTSRPNDSTYTYSMIASKLSVPDQRFNEKSLNEYYLCTPGDDDQLLTYARYAEALRGGMVQISSEKRSNLPAPLHLAALAEEYVWSWKWKSKKEE